jgi:3-deoxy-D-manno-octulosonic-acid transferase
MARSLSLAAYLALTRRAPGSMPDIEMSRPDGALVWINASDVERVRALLQLGRRLMAQRAGLNLLLTVPADILSEIEPQDGMIVQAVPPEIPGDIDRFLDHWRPDLCLWLGTNLRPALIDVTSRKDVPLILLDATAGGWDHPKVAWLPEPTKGALRLFDTVLSRSDAATDRLRRMGVAGNVILPSGPFLEDSTALPYNESDYEELSATLVGRPVWLAAKVQLDELATVLSAHRQAMRLAHRLLLVLVPANPSDAREFKERCAWDGWRSCEWAEGDFPSETTQILLTEDAFEMGLWYRVAPVSFMGSSLVAGYGGCSPYDAAALGSAIIYGPGVRNYLDAYSRLAKAGAVRIVRDADSLAQALIQLNAPDQVAAMAHAGWEVVSAGAEVTDQIINLVQDMLDAAGVD